MESSAVSSRSAKQERKKLCKGNRGAIIGMDLRGGYRKSQNNDEEKITEILLSSGPIGCLFCSSCMIVIVFDDDDRNMMMMVP